MISPQEAWSPLPANEWNNATARHLAVRLGFSLNPALVATIEQMGPIGTLKSYFGSIRLQPATAKVAQLEETMMGLRKEMRDADSEDKRDLRKKLQQANQQSYQDYGVEWYQFARDPRNSAQEKLVLFFQDLWVVAQQGVRSTTALFDYQNLIRRHLGSTYPEMCKALATTPAMVRYLNLNQNRKGSPNENFARELFELFCLGEGNYTENDIKQAARATTGYTLNQMDEVGFNPKRHDPGPKTIFGQTGNYDLPQLVDLVFEQPAAARFLPKEMARFYLTDDGLTDEMVQPLADLWHKSGYSIPRLLVTFFNSRIFYDRAYRGNKIKSPVEFYLGLHQDLDLDIFPSPRRCVNQLRRMGQQFYNPPNVRGWVGGRHWINSATLAARRAAVQGIMYPINMDNLNADEERAMKAAMSEGRTAFTVNEQQLLGIARMEPEAIAERLAQRFYVDPDPTYLKQVFTAMRKSSEGRKLAADCMVAALTAPSYQLC
ncbi:MAG: DUF1800 domain-containing protein [Opitutales bacterium]|jgi:uncharacterized protein (DUF1800 family)